MKCRGRIQIPADTVFKLYGLTGDEVALVRRTAPPRDPLTILEKGTAPFSS